MIEQPPRREVIAFDIPEPWAMYDRFVRVCLPLIALIAPVVPIIAGCGRVGFDSRIDAAIDAPDARVRVCTPIGNDEDGDGIDDACDGCPHFADAEQPDADGDLVNDGCDPYPTPTETLTVFETFHAVSPVFEQFGPTPTYTAAGVSADTRGTGRLTLRRALAPARIRMILGGTVRASLDVMSRQLTLAIGGPGVTAFYCELQGETPNAKFAATYTLDAVDYIVVANTGSNPFENGDFELTITSDLTTTPPTIVCESTWPVTQSRLTADLPSGVFMPERVGFGAQEVDITFRYYVEIASN